MSGPLAGLLVLDASQGAVGPWTGALLGQLGADVLKLEAPGGDFLRHIMPAKRGLSAAYIAMNVNKRAITLDLKNPAERAQVHRLADAADIFIENFRPGVADRIGVGYTELSALNKRLIYASASGFGKTGPMARIGATDPHIQAFTGSTSVNGLPGAPRQRWRFYVHFDCTTALCIVQGVLAALLERQRTGRGLLVEVTMVEAAMALQRVRLSEHMAGGQPRPMGSSTTYLVPDQAFRTLDAWITVSVTSRRQWRGFCTALGRPDLADDQRFSTNPQRVTHREALLSIIEPIIAAAPAPDWLRRFADAQVPAGRFTDFHQFRHHAHYLANGMVQRMDTQWGKLTTPGVPWDFTATQAHLRPGSAPGEHTHEVIDGAWPPMPAA